MSEVVKRSGSSPFRARARLIRLLGEELISDEVMAVVELVKNGYDADARRVRVVLEGVTSRENGAGLIRIEDDGYGMDLQTILYSWMEPATHHKRAKGSGGKVRTVRGRVQLGEKGVGRFAADKLGSELELVSRKAGAAEETVVQVGWQHYEHDRYLDEVENSWFTREPLEFAGGRHGTVLLIRKLRARSDTELVGRVHNGLMRLVTPFAGVSEFVIEVSSEEFPGISGRVINPLLATAPYRLTGLVDKQGMLSVEEEGVGDREVDLRPLCQGRFGLEGGGFRETECGPFRVSLNVWDLEPVNRNGTGVDQTRRAAVKACSGVSIYRDGFRVWPYGEKDDDWLELNQRRVNNPTLRVSNNQVIGFVEITHQDNPGLRDRTSREGLIDTGAFFDLKGLVVAALSVLETERFGRRRPGYTAFKKVVRVEEDEVLQSFARVRAVANDANGSQVTGVRGALQEVERLYRERMTEERERYNQVSRLAGTGMAAEVLTDAFARDIAGARRLLSTLQGEVQNEGNVALKNLIETLAERMEAVSEKLDLMEPLYRPKANENAPVNMSGVIYDVVAILGNRLEETGTRVVLAGTGGMEVRINRGHLMQVLMILVENAVGVLKEAGTAGPTVEIRVVDEPGWKGLAVSDNGPGVSEGIRKLIFQPYFSARQAGRGLGLHVARDILDGYNCTLDLVLRQDRPELTGACFEVRFDGRRVVQ